jgi:hypothetical protein
MVVLIEIAHPVGIGLELVVSSRKAGVDLEDVGGDALVDPYQDLLDNPLVPVLNGTVEIGGGLGYRLVGLVEHIGGEPDGLAFDIGGLVQVHVDYLAWLLTVGLEGIDDLLLVPILCEGGKDKTY